MPARGRISTEGEGAIIQDVGEDEIIKNLVRGRQKLLLTV